MREAARPVIAAAAALVLGGCAGGSGAHVEGAQTRKDLAATGWRVTSLAVPGTSRLCSVRGRHPRVFLSAVAVGRLVALLHRWRVRQAG